MLKLLHSLPLFLSVLHGTPLRQAIDQFDKSGGAVQAAALNQRQEDPMVACYIDSAFPAMLLFAYRYAHSFEECILASANAGGENVARGALLGALLGAQYGMQSPPPSSTPAGAATSTSGIPTWAMSLKNAEAIMSEIDNLVSLQ